MIEILLVIIGFLACLLVQAWMKVEFYGAYFDEKQKHMGRAPDQVVKSAFPAIWWLLR